MAVLHQGSNPSLGQMRQIWPKCIWEIPGRVSGNGTPILIVTYKEFSQNFFQFLGVG
jgi:hypothetical protein